MAETLNIGIIGLGHLHPRTYMPHFAATPGVKVVAVADPLAELRAGFEKDFKVKTYADWRELLKRESIGLAYLFLPHDECPAAAEACAAQGIHVVVEKPVANTSKGAGRIAAACKRHKVLFSTPYLWRYHPVCREMKRIIDAGWLGRIVGCEGRCAAGGLHRYIEGHSPWMLQKKKSGGGPMYNLGVHWIDLYRWLLGCEVKSAMGRNVRVNQKHDIEDNSFAILTFENEATLALDISYTVPDSYPCGRDLYLAIRGTEGCINFTPAFEGTRRRMVVCRNHKSDCGAQRKVISFELENVPGYCGSLGLEYVREMAENVRKRKAPFIGGNDAVRALEVVEAVYRSNESGKIVKV